jgi:hypothetical protein
MVAAKKKTIEGRIKAIRQQIEEAIATTTKRSSRSG